VASGIVHLGYDKPIQSNRKDSKCKDVIYKGDYIENSTSKEFKYCLIECLKYDDVYAKFESDKYRILSTIKNNSMKTPRNRSFLFKSHSLLLQSQYRIYQKRFFEHIGIRLKFLDRSHCHNSPTLELGFCARQHRLFYSLLIRLAR